jgi:hypothetical protein
MTFHGICETLLFLTGKDSLAQQTQTRMPIWYCVMLLIAIVSLAGAWYLSHRNRQWIRETIGPRQLLSAIGLMILFECLTYLFWVVIRDGQIGTQGYILFLLQGYCFMTLWLQNLLFQKSAMYRELITLDLLSKQREKQFQISKDNMELINRKCHDLKHQVAALRHVMESEQSRAYMKELEDALELHDARVETGNETLDTLLTEKRLHGVKNGIQIHCVADGAQLSFLDPVDLYTIFGNAMDNAMECVERIANPKKRQIDVLIYRQQQFVMVNILNPLEDTLEFEDGLPKTTKSDKRYHGYGLKSIAHTAKQYGGVLTVAVEDDCFSLKLLFPR